MMAFSLSPYNTSGYVGTRIHISETCEQKSTDNGAYITISNPSSSNSVDMGTVKFSQ